MIWFHLFQSFQSFQSSASMPLNTRLKQFQPKTCHRSRDFLCCSPDEVKRNPGSLMSRNGVPDFAALHPGYGNEIYSTVRVCVFM